MSCESLQLAKELHMTSHLRGRGMFALSDEALDFRSAGTLHFMQQASTGLQCKTCMLSQYRAFYDLSEKVGVIRHETP